jgi:hypothetical protein
MLYDGTLLMFCIGILSLWICLSRKHFLGIICIHIGVYQV